MNELATVSSSTPLLSVRDLRTSFLNKNGWSEVLHGISFDVKQGEIVALVGESGSGKSVTSLSVMRLNHPRRSRSTGRIDVAGKNILTLSDRAMESIRGDEIAMIFQEPTTSLNPVLTIGWQICETLRVHRGMGRQEAMRYAISLLDRVGIPAARSRLEDYPHSFSGGMRQRVMIAMALACRPKLLIADEPTTALDVTVQAQILELIRDLRDESGMSVLLITHDMGVVAETADRTEVMYRGNIVEGAPTARIFAAPRKPYTRALIGSVPKLGAMKGKALPEPFDVVDQETGKVSKPRFAVPAIDPDVKPVLEVHNLTTRFTLRKGLLARPSGRVHAVEDVSFVLKPGETLSLVGESGCGKSTTGRSVMRLLKPDAGKVLLEGKDLLGANAAELRRARGKIQMVFQDPFASMNPRLSVASSIVEPLVMQGELSRKAMMDRVCALFEEVGLSSEMATRYPHEFSGGQRQRLCIARALAASPRVLVADEAVSALDVSVKVQVVNLLLELQARRGLAMLFISHDMAVVERVSHRVAVMYLGEIVEIGQRDAVLSNPQHSYTRRLLNAVPVPDPAKPREKVRPAARELKSPIRPLDYRPPERHYHRVGEDHLVMAE